MKILFKIKFHTGQTVEILSNLRWFGKNQPLITEMGDEHIRNARVWLYNKINTLSILGYNLPINNGFDYGQWLVILANEENRRLAIIEKAKFDEVEMLRIAAMSSEMRKSKARKLLSNPSEENINEAKKLLQIKIADKKSIATTKSESRTFTGSVRDFSGSDTFDHYFDAMESMMSHNGF